MARKGYDASQQPLIEKVLCYEIEYIELKENYDIEEDNADFDLFLVKKETFYNLKEVSGLEVILSRWVDDFSVFEPISNVSHPMT